MLEPLEDEIRTLHAILGSDRDPDGRAFAPLADAYRRAGQPRKAVGLLTDGLARLPDFTSGHVVAARLYAEQGLFAEGELAARRALELDPDNVIAMAVLVRVLQSAGRTGEAAEARSALSLLEPEVLDEEGLGEEDPVLDPADLAPDGPIMELADLAPDAPVMEIADLAPDLPVIEASDLAPDGPIMELADLAPDEPVMEIADLAPDEPVIDAGDPAPDEPVMELADLAPDALDEPAPPTAAWRNPDHGRSSDAGGGSAPRIYTRTLGELYARQGFVDRAIEVFRQLHSENPDDEALAERLRELEGSDQPPVLRTDPAAPAADRLRERDEELESLARDLAGQRREEPVADTPFAWTGREEPEEAPAGDAVGPSIASYFDDLLAWQPKDRA